MRHILSFLLFFGLWTATNAQIVITEIMYNPPESGNDSLEYIEIYNAGAQVVNLEGYGFAQGVNFDFPNVDMAAGDYLIIAIDTQALKNTLGVTGALQWESGALSNGGEDIIITDAQGNQVDLVEYQNGGDWPSDPNGNGASLELCDPFRDNNDGANWKASQSAKGVVINDFELNCTPGEENDVSCANYTIEVRNNFFDPDTLVINIGETVEWVAIEGFHNVNGNQNTYPNNPQGFGSGAPMNAPWTFNHTFNIAGNYDYQCDPHRLLGMVGYIQVIDNPVEDIKMTEIMYNDPGSDTTEFVEIYNNGMDTVNLNGYRFINGIDVTFGDINMAPGDYLVVAASPGYMLDSFGVDAIGFTGQLNNGGEAIELVDAQGRTVDRVVYDSESPWDTRADGEGYSLVLCDVSADNDMASNWGASATPTPIIIERRQIFCSPGAPNVCDIQKNEYPLYDIATISTVDALGFPDSNNVTCAIQGVVHGVDLQGNDNIQFTIIDQTGGIGVFSGENFNYTVNEGDELLLKGVIVEFNGLTQMNPDSLRIISTGGSPFTPRVVTELNESTESEIIQILDVRFVDPARWRGDGSSFNIDVTDGNSVFNIRIDDDVDLANLPEPSQGNSMNITGLGGQFDRDEPLTDGYQLLPRYMEDIDIISSSDDFVLEKVSIMPNPAEDFIIIQGRVPGMKVTAFNTFGQAMMVEQTGQILDCSQWPSGAYTLRIEYGDSARTIKLMKK